MADDDLLRGWKEIATFLRTTDRTAQRWESSLDLPVHRIETSRSAVVFASRRELGTWVRRAHTTETVDVAVGLPADSGMSFSAGDRIKRGVIWGTAAVMVAMYLLRMGRIGPF